MKRTFGFVAVAVMVMVVSGTAFAGSAWDDFKKSQAGNNPIPELEAKGEQPKVEDKAEQTADKDVNGHQDDKDAQASEKLSDLEAMKKSLGIKTDGEKLTEQAKKNVFNSPAEAKKFFRNVVTHPAPSTNGQICMGPKKGSFKVPEGVGILIVNTDTGKDAYPGDMANVDRQCTIWWASAGLVDGTEVWDQKKQTTVKVGTAEEQYNLPVYKEPVRKTVNEARDWASIACEWKPSKGEDGRAWTGKANEPTVVRVPQGWEVNFMLDGRILTAKAGQDVLLKDGAYDFTARAKNAWDPNTPDGKPAPKKGGKKR